MTEKQLVPAPESWKKTFERVFNNKWTHSLAFLTVATYILGFVIVHQHLSKYGIYDFEIGSAHYLSSGIIFFVYLVVYYIFSGSSIIDEPKFGTYGDLIKRVGAKRALALIPIRLIYVSVDSLFYTCISASIFSMFAFILPLSNAFLVCVIGCLFVKVLFVAEIARLYPKISAITETVIKIPAIFSFFYTMGNWQIHAVFGSYISISLLVFFLLKKNNASKRGARIGFYTVVLLLFYAFVFGRLFYGEIPRKYGGGQPLHADIQLREEYTSLFPNRENSTPMNGVKIIHMTDKHIYIDENRGIIRLPDYSIVGMKINGNTDKEN